jgi:hypothetical protein
MRISVTISAQVELRSGRVEGPGARCPDSVERIDIDVTAAAGVDLVHFPAQPEPLLSLDLPKISHKKHLR